jgi:hypothetical protein
MKVVGELSFQSSLNRTSPQNEWKTGSVKTAIAQVKGSGQAFKVPTACTGAQRIDPTPQQFRSRIVATVGIANHPISPDPCLFSRAIGGLHKEGDLVQMVASGFELIAMSPFQHRVGLTLQIKVGTRLGRPIEIMLAQRLLGRL